MVSHFQVNVQQMTFFQCFRKDNIWSNKRTCCISLFRSLDEYILHDAPLPLSIRLANNKFSFRFKIIIVISKKSIIFLQNFILYICPVFYRILYNIKVKKNEKVPIMEEKEIQTFSKREQKKNN